MGLGFITWTPKPWQLQHVALNSSTVLPWGPLCFSLPSCLSASPQGLALRGPVIY